MCWSTARLAPTLEPLQLQHSHAHSPPVTIEHLVPATVHGTRMVLYAAHAQSASVPTVHCLAPGAGTPRQLARSTIRELAQPLADLSYCEATQQLVAVSSSAVLTVFAPQTRSTGGPPSWAPLATVQLRQAAESGSVTIVWLGATLLGCLHSSNSVMSMYDLQAEEQHHLAAGAPSVPPWLGVVLVAAAGRTHHRHGQPACSRGSGCIQRHPRACNLCTQSA